MFSLSVFSSLRPASFRGVPFEVDGHDETGGRRLAKHEYPLRDIPYAEDLGRKAGVWSVTAFLVQHRGFDVRLGRDALREALNAAGPGTLIHPWLGELEVCVDTFSLKETTSQGGYAAFTISFVEAGVNANPKVETDTAAAAAAAAGNLKNGLGKALEGALGAISDVFTEVEKTFAMIQHITNLPQRYIADALAIVSRVAGGPLALVDRVFGIVDWARGMHSGSGFSSLFPAAIRASLGISLPEFGPAAKIGFKGEGSEEKSTGKSNPAQGLTATVIILVVDPSGNPVNAGTAPASGTSAVRWLVASALVSSAARAVAQTAFATADDALAARDEIADALDILMDTSPDEIYPLLADLRVAVVRDLTTRGAKLPSLTRVTLPGTVPALAAAYRIYSDATWDTEIISRNNIRHPGRVPGGTPLEVLLT